MYYKKNVYDVVYIVYLGFSCIVRCIMFCGSNSLLGFIFRE